jgi:hypothetical protein
MDPVATYDHVISINAENARLTIYRLYGDGSRTLHTFVDLPAPQSAEEALRAFCERLGENILLDTPAGRKLLRAD